MFGMVAEDLKILCSKIIDSYPSVSKKLQGRPVRIK